MRKTAPQYKQRRKPRQKPEEGIQRVCAEILTYFVPGPPEGPFWTAINPVAAKSKAVAGISKAMGLRAGVPDLLMIHQSRPILTEFKAGTGGRVDPEQKARHAEILNAGGAVHVARSVEEFVAILDAHEIPCRVDRASVAARRPSHSRHT